MIVIVVDAEERTLQHIDNMKITNGEVSKPINGIIHGPSGGMVVFDELKFTLDHPSEKIIDLVVTTLPNTYNHHDNKSSMKKVKVNNNNKDEKGEHYDNDKYWQLLGIGSYGKDDDGIYYKCCTEVAMNAGACGNGESNELGRMIVNDPSHVKLHTQMSVSGRPSSLNSNNGSANRREIDGGGMWPGERGFWRGATSGGRNKHHDVRWNRDRAYFTYTTRVVIVIGNCNGDSSSSSGTVTVDGDIYWTSKIGGLFDKAMIFPYTMMLLHAIVVFWYRHRLNNCPKTTRIQIEYCMYYVLLLASVSTTMDVIYLCMETMFIQHEHLLLRIITDFLNKVSHIGSRCFYVILAHGGLGVIRTDISRVTKCSLIMLGILILLLKETYEGMCDLSFLRRENVWQSEYYGMTRIKLWKVSLYFNWIYAIWIPIALVRTMRYLKLTDENIKLQRYRWLLRIYVITIILCLIMYAPSYFRYFAGHYHHHGHHNMGRDDNHHYSHHVVSKRKNFGIFNHDFYDKVNHVIYWMALTSIAILWRPRPEAPMYGYVQLEDDGPNNNNNQNNSLTTTTKGDLELMETTTSSAASSAASPEEEAML